MDKLNLKIRISKPYFLGFCRDKWQARLVDIKTEEYIIIGHYSTQQEAIRLSPNTARVLLTTVLLKSKEAREEWNRPVPLPRQ